MCVYGEKMCVYGEKMCVYGEKMCVYGEKSMQSADHTAFSDAKIKVFGV